MKLFPASAAIAVIGFFSASAAPTSPPQLYPSQSLSNSQSVSNSRDEEPREGKGSRMGKGYSSVPSSRPTRFDADGPFGSTYSPSFTSSPSDSSGKGKGGKGSSFSNSNGKGKGGKGSSFSNSEGKGKGGKGSSFSNSNGKGKGGKGKGYTASPTWTPTSSPTGSPTSLPRGSPTFNPTDPPTSLPTRRPTRLPTTSPTDPPASLPTQSPTKNPTNPPTAVPTSEPTTASPTHDGVCQELNNGDAIVGLPFSFRFTIQSAEGGDRWGWYQEFTFGADTYDGFHEMLAGAGTNNAGGNSYVGSAEVTVADCTVNPDGPSTVVFDIPGNSGVCVKRADVDHVHVHTDYPRSGPDISFEPSQYLNRCCVPNQPCYVVLHSSVIDYYCPTQPDLPCYHDLARN